MGLQLSPSTDVLDSEAKMVLEDSDVEMIVAEIEVSVSKNLDLYLDLVDSVSVVELLQ